MEDIEDSAEDVPAYRPPGRPGIAPSRVYAAADALFREGVRPTIEKVRERVGGSPNRITKYLEDWWATLAKRVEIGNAVFDRLPTSYAHLAESFFHQSMDEFRRIAKAETTKQHDEIDAKAEMTHQRSLMLDEREKEISAVIAERDARVSALETALRERTAQLGNLTADHQILLRQVNRLNAELRRRQASILVGKLGNAATRKSLKGAKLRVKRSDSSPKLRRRAATKRRSNRA